MTAEAIANYGNNVAQQAEYTVSFKGDGAYDAPLIAIKGQDAGQVGARVAQAFGLDQSKYANLADLVVDASVQMRAAHTLLKGGAAQGSQQQGLQDTSQGFSGPVQGGTTQEGGVAPQNGAQGLPQGVQKFCEHGPRQRKTGNNNNGQWVGHFCPLPKGAPGQCKPVWND